MEAGTIQDKIDFRYGPETLGMGGVINSMPAFQNINRENADISRTPINVYICPSDSRPTGEWIAQNNYAGNQGGWLCDRGDSPGGPNDVSPSETQTGVFYWLSGVRMADIIDGTSNTAFFSERIRGPGTPKPRSDMFVIANQNSLQDTYLTCNNLNPATATPLTSKWGWSWGMGENCCTLKNHVSGPNTRSCAGLPFPGGNMTNMSMQVAPSSYHPGVVNMLMGDGSIRFVPNTVDLLLWRRLGTRAGSDIVIQSQN